MVINIKITGSLSDALDEAKASIEAVGGYFEGDTTNGEFSGKGVEGTYIVYGGKSLTVLISKKPFFASESKIESKIRDFFE